MSRGREWLSWRPLKTVSSASALDIRRYVNIHMESHRARLLHRTDSGFFRSLSAFGRRMFVNSWYKSVTAPQGQTLGHAYHREWSPRVVSLSDVASLIADRSRVRFLKGLSRQGQDAILAAASYRRFSKNSIVTQQEDPADQLFLLLKGSARYFFITPGGRKVYLHWLAPGEIFGGASLLCDPSRFLVSTEVAKNSSALVWERETIRNLAVRYPQLLENGLTIANDYLTWYLASHLSLTCHNARERLAHVLVSLANGIGTTHPDGIHLHVTNEQLANTSNISLFTASRLLSAWQRSGCVLKGRGKIILRRPDRLPRN
jgi:CRP/FNR family transcriptional regulator, nitrogen oxide reductase regulator